MSRKPYPSTFNAWGYRPTGIALLFGNYRNGAKDRTIAAEYIHRDDHLNGAALCTEAARQVPMRWDTAFSSRGERLVLTWKAGWLG